MIKIVMMIELVNTQGMGTSISWKIKIKNAVTKLSFFQTHTQVTVDNRYREV